MRTMFFTLAIALVSACGDDGGKTTNKPPVDANNGGGDDAPITPTEDAPPTGGNALGQACTPTQGAMTPEQGDCPAGYVCLGLQGGTHPWCSKTCTAGAGGNTACQQGYTGPGLAACVFGVENAGSFCGIVCQDNTANHQICTAQQCDGTCPSTPALMCTAPLVDQNMNTVAKACQ